MEKLSKVRSKLDDPQTENLRKLFLAMAKDFRVVLLKLCDRLHNMRTLEFIKPEKRLRIAHETLNVYAPIAGRLGIYRLKSQLEDLCFKNLNPEVYEDIHSQLMKTEKWREQYIENAKKVLNETLAKEGILAVVDGRAKSTYSIHRKLQKKGKDSVDEIFDIFAMRVILPDIYKYGKEYTGHIYTTLGILHNCFTPLANRFKDYVAVPKINGYRSLHTTVMGLGQKDHMQPTEVQIRTSEMHNYAEFGVASHWMYEEEKSVGFGGMACDLKKAQDKTPATLEQAVASTSAPLLKQHKDWILKLEKIQKNIKNNSELMENLSVDLFNDRIFVMTPRGDVKDLPIGASPVDFAYAVHTDVGNMCVGAKVNGNIVPINYALKNGEVVDIITRKNAAPSQYWLSFVRTAHARNRVRAWFRNLDGDKNLKDGKRLLNEKLQQLGKPPLDDSLGALRVMDGKKLSLKDRQDLLKDIGKGAFLPCTVLKRVFTLEELLIGRRHEKKMEVATQPKKIPVEEKEKPEVYIGGEPNMPYNFVRCCDASFKDELVGYVTRGRGISIHKKDCPVLQNMKDARLIPVRVAGGIKKYPISIRVEVEDRVGIIRDISSIFVESKINIIDFSQGEKEMENSILNFIVEIEYFDQLDSVLSNLEKVQSVRRAVKLN
ncbi:MAG: RelA/SpoT family protein, partial [Patescibacteria group bacterium]